MIERYSIAGYCRISVDEELDRDNTSIENQKSIITDFVKHRFPDSTLTFFEDRDRSGYTFEQLYADRSQNGWGELLSVTDYLIDGPFILAQKSYEVRFRGSKNKRYLDCQASLK